MRNYILNKNTNEKVEVKLATINGNEKWWCDAETGKPIMKATAVSEYPKGVSVSSDCSLENDMIVQRIKKIRTAKGLSLRQMEVLTGISNQNISKVENGYAASTTIETLTRLLSPLGYKVAVVPIEY